MGASLFNSSQLLETRSQFKFPSSLLSVLCWVEDSVISFLPFLTVSMEKLIHRDIEAICNILYGLSEESLLLCFPAIFFLHCSQESHCIPASIFVPLVCVSVLCKIRYTRDVKTTVMQVVN